MSPLLLALAVALSTTPTALAKKAGEKSADGNAHAAVVSRVKDLVGAFAAKDAKRVVALMDFGAQALLMGPDASEVCQDAACAEKLLKDGFALVDSIRATELPRPHLQVSGALATAVFDLPLETQIGEAKTKSVSRFSTTWRLTGGEWRLVQFVRSVATVDRSAKDLLKENVLK